MHLTRYLVTPAELQTALTSSADSNRIVPLSAAWFLPNDPEGRTGIQSFTNRRVPGSAFFDLDKVKDASSPWPHMLPDSQTFATEMGKLGVTREDTVVVYDTAELGLFSAPRVAWMLKVFGHPKVHLLNNFKTWVEEGRETESGNTSTPKETRYEMPQPWSTAEHVAGFEEMQETVRSPKNGTENEAPVLLDARPMGRWAGSAPEPRPGMPSGHMPGSRSVAFSEVLDPKDKTMLPAEKLRELFKSKGIPRDQEIIASCGTGVTAAVLDAALHEAQWTTSSRRIYDGSWTEWATRLEPQDGWIVKTV